MKILGIETSCDETAAAVVQDGTRILSNVVVSQIDIHASFGGVVPEVAARSHIEAILPVIDEAVKPVGWDNIDAIAVTTHPGLIGSLLIGVLTAKTLALTKNKPLYPIDHIEAHVYANFLESDFLTNFSSPPTSPSGLSQATSPSSTSRVGTLSLGQPHRSSSVVNGSEKSVRKSVPEFPLLALVVSGGHTQIVLFRGHGEWEILGQTRDDAVGEAFDKVAKILGLPYPGGPSIAAAAKQGNAEKYQLPKPKLDTPLEFSFSGLKTALLRAVQSECGKDFTFPSSQLAELLSTVQRNDFAASFQKVAIEILVDKIESAFIDYQPKSVVIAGGVAANTELRRQLSERLPIEINYPAPELCTDNAAVVASLGYFVAQNTKPTNPADISVTPTK